MALQLDKTLPIGVTANYWQITEIKINFIFNQATVTLGLWLNEKEATNNPQSGIIETKNLDYSGDTFPFTSDALQKSDPLTIAYSTIATSQLDENGQETNQFASATPVPMAAVAPIAN